MGLWYELIDLLLPWRCPLCRGAGRLPSGACRDCLDSLLARPGWRCLVCGHPLPDSGGPCCRSPREYHLDALLAVAVYGEPVRRLVHLYKYGGQAPAGRVMKVLLEEAIDKCLDIPCRAVVPVPLSRSRQAERGYNQAALLARHLGRRLGLPVRDRVLVKTRETGHQADLSAAERRKNLCGAFALSRSDDLAGQSFLLVDDVYTTGTTMNECARVLKEGGAAAVFGAVFACSVSVA